MTIRLLIVPVAFREVILVGQLQHKSKQHQQLLHDVVVDVASKMLYLCPVGIDDLRLSPLEFWDEFGDVENLRVVEDAGLDFLEGGSARQSF